MRDSVDLGRPIPIPSEEPNGRHPSPPSSAQCCQLGFVVSRSRPTRGPRHLRERNKRGEHQTPRGHVLRSPLLQFFPPHPSSIPTAPFSFPLFPHFPCHCTTAALPRCPPPPSRPRALPRSASPPPAAPTRATSAFLLLLPPPAAAACFSGAPPLLVAAMAPEAAAAPTRPSRSSAAARPSSPRALRPASSRCKAKAPGQLQPLLLSFLCGYLLIV